MDNQQLLVRIALDAWNLNVKRTTDAFNGFTDEQMFIEIAPGRNRLVYLLGHLTAVDDRMLPLLSLGNRQYEQLDEAFITNPDRAIAGLPAITDLRTYWANINDVLTSHFNQLTPGDWLQRHTSISEEDFVKEPHRNRLSVLISRTNHISFHLGQIMLVKK